MRVHPSDPSKTMTTCASVNQVFNIVDGGAKLRKDCILLTEGQIGEHESRKGAIVTRYSADTDGPFHDHAKAAGLLKKANSNVKRREATKTKNAAIAAAAKISKENVSVVSR